MTIIDKIRKEDYMLPDGYTFATIESKRHRRIRYIKEALVGASLSFILSYLFVLACLAFGPMVGYGILALCALGAITFNAAIV